MALLVTLHGHRVILRTSKNKVTKETTVAAPLSVHVSGLPAYPVALSRLQGFRGGLYSCFTRRADACSTWPTRCSAPRRRSRRCRT
jgi:hypothetical protein